jgi:hypothetical protein
LDGVWFLSMNLLFLATEQDEITRMSAYKSKGPISYDLVVTKSWKRCCYCTF